MLTSRLELPVNHSVLWRGVTLLFPGISRIDDSIDWHRLFAVLDIAKDIDASGDNICVDDTPEPGQDDLGMLRNGDQEAWRTCVEQWSPKLLRYLRYSLPTEQDAQDLLSETWVAVVRSIRSFDGRSSLATWLYAIAHHKLVDFYKAKRNTPTEQLDDDLPESDERISAEALDLRAAMSRLNPEQRRVLLLKYREGFSTDEIARIIARSYKATESLLTRSRERLKTELLGGA